MSFVSDGGLATLATESASLRLLTASALTDAHLLSSIGKPVEVIERKTKQARQGECL